MEHEERQSKYNMLRQKIGRWFWPLLILIILFAAFMMLALLQPNNPESGRRNFFTSWQNLSPKSLSQQFISNYGNIPFLGPIINSLTGSNHKKIFTDDFSGDYRVEEDGKRADSLNPNWWVNSGGWMVVSGGTGKTVQGDLESSDKWFKNYKKNNPDDTDGGAHPQNIFRLVGREKWQNFSQEVYFRINKMNFSESMNRNESNGFLLFNRYQDGDNLYYTGLRVDGYSVIKKKLKGDYHTLAEEKIFPGPDYDRDKNPNLLPVGKWMGIKTEVKTIASGAVQINLYYKENRDSGDWKLVSDYIDTGQKGAEITSPGYGGIRTDFMDVEFSDYKIAEF